MVSDLAPHSRNRTATFSSAAEIIGTCCVLFHPCTQKKNMERIYNTNKWTTAVEDRLSNVDYCSPGSIVDCRLSMNDQTEDRLSMVNSRVSIKPRGPVNAANDRLSIIDSSWTDCRYRLNRRKAVSANRLSVIEYSISVLGKLTA